MHENTDMLRDNEAWINKSTMDEKRETGVKAIYYERLNVFPYRIENSMWIVLLQ